MLVCSEAATGKPSILRLGVLPWLAAPLAGRTCRTSAPAKLNKLSEKTLTVQKPCPWCHYDPPRCGNVNLGNL